MNKPSDDLDYAAEVVDKTVQPELVVKAEEVVSHVRHSSEITAGGADKDGGGDETTIDSGFKARGIISFYFLRIVSTLLDLIYCGIILGILSLLLIFCCIFLGKVNPDQNKFAVQMIYWTCLLTLPAVEAWMHFKLQDKGALPLPASQGVRFF